VDGSNPELKEPIATSGIFQESDVSGPNYSPARLGRGRRDGSRRRSRGCRHKTVRKAPRRRHRVVQGLRKIWAKIRIPGRSRSSSRIKDLGVDDSPGPRKKPDRTGILVSK
jgi:hypothetical protein